ncbi:hypothetical protein [Yersinia pseudotuberculosis]|uniref:GapS6a family protein n=1 Tax=Yersinia pseudotuberculosis TaxID=633 RepID=UPI0005E7CBF7|nr:hypothetical protein [Yersinia pseudotuberculosis]CNB74447.1 Uncharacterised protein [Yersinia pseudotuberculosis]
MNFLTSTILSGVLYDGMRTGAVMSVDLIKRSLQKWLIDDETAKFILDKMMTLDVNENLSEHAIQRKIHEDNELTELLKRIPLAPKTINHVSTHNGSGDIVHGNKIIKNH